MTDTFWRCISLPNRNLMCIYEDEEWRSVRQETRPPLRAIVPSHTASMSVPSLFGMPTITRATARSAITSCPTTRAPRFLQHFLEAFAHENITSASPHINIQHSQPSSNTIVADIMVVTNLMFTVAADGLAKGAQVPRRATVKRKQKKASASTPLETARGSTGSPLFPIDSKESSEINARMTTETGDQSNAQPASETNPLQATVLSISPTPAPPPPGALDAEEDSPDASILDPTNSLRKYYREEYTGVQREIWRPGDGDGLANTDRDPSRQPVPPIWQRWRFYQSHTGPIDFPNKTPPKYVILDDRGKSCSSPYI
jgi:hypothetical protein